MSGILTVVGTPLGNLGDMSPRAVEALRQADFIAAEDTRVTLKLLNHFEIKKPMISYFEHNRKFHGELICQKIEAGENCGGGPGAALRRAGDHRQRGARAKRPHRGTGGFRSADGKIYL